MTDLAEFLLARIAEGEAKARTEGPTQPHEQSCGWRLQEGPGFSDDGCTCGLPDRVLAECEAKRRIVEEHCGGTWPHPSDPCDAHNADFETVPCDTLRYLALPYTEHEDFCSEWQV